MTTENRHNIVDIEFIGEIDLETGSQFQETVIGGLSGITYNPNLDEYYSISDDRGQNNPARYYTLDIDLSDGSFDEGDLNFTKVTTLLNAQSNPYVENGIDPEGIAYDGSDIYISSEGNINEGLNPFIEKFSLTGLNIDSLPIDNKFLPNIEQTQGVRNNLAFESLTISPDRQTLYSATETALTQDGPIPSLDTESASRIFSYNLTSQTPTQEYLYFTDPIPVPPDPVDAFADNGLVELIALDNQGTLLSLERSFASGVGNNIRLYQIQLQGATDISGVDSLTTDTETLVDVDAPVQKELLLDFGDLGITLDNFEGMSLGPILPDGRQSLIVVSDNNFSENQSTKFFAFALEVESIPVINATTETPSEIRYGSPENPDPNNIPDGDDPAIYVHPEDSAESLVITTFKDGGLRVYDLAGQEIQRIAPENIRYNNVDLVYDFPLGNEKIDLAIASDRRNDTLAIFAINPDTRQLTDITAPALSNLGASIFGIDDGEQTAYGLTTYTSPISNQAYVFVSQRDGDQIAQLALIPTASGEIDAEIVRTFTVPIPPEGELEDAQVEGMVADRELGYLYVGQENFGIWKFLAEPNTDTTPILVDQVGDNLTADVEGLTIYYGDSEKGYLFVSSQGDSTYAIYERSGDNNYLGSFAIGNGDEIDGVEESDGADIINVSLGEAFPNGLMVVHDGSNDPAVVFPDPEEGEIQNYNTNFKYLDLADIPGLELDTQSYQPRATSLVNGVASGDTTQNSTVLWTRSTVLGDVTFAYSTDPEFGQIAGEVTATVTDSSLPVKVQINDLNPNTRYYYSVTDAIGNVDGGTFKTAANVNQQTGLRFGVSGDWRGELAPYQAIANAANQELDFFVEHGDTIYADYPSNAVLNPDGTPKEQAETLEEYRAKQSEVYSERLGVNYWSDLRASTSVFATIDDHEVINDFSGGAYASSDPRFEETTGLINDTQLYENGLQAFQEYNPIQDLFYGETGDPRTEGERKLYRYQQYGKDGAIFVLDARSFRDEPLEAPDLTNSREVLRFQIQSLIQDRQFLGDPQLAELKQDLLTAQEQDITWKFIMVPEPIQEFGIYNVDAFEGYAHQRTELLEFITENQIDNVVFVAADIHGTVVNNLTYQENLRDVITGDRIATNMFEITTGSVAFDPPFGPTVIDVATESDLITPLQKAIYDSLPIAPDSDDLINDKDDFLKAAFQDLAISPGGFDPIGLDDNLPQAEGLIDATLLQGDYFATHTYGWTQFDIDPETQKLTVTTYGIESYSESDILTTPESILQPEPQIVSQFEVNPVV